MNDAELAARQRASQREMYRVLGEGSPAGRAVELPGGVLAAVVPERPGRSVLNAAVYEDGEALLAARDDLAAVYDAAGVHAWTVWVHPGDEAVARGLAAAGHVHDGRPMLMAAPIAEIDLEPRRTLELALEPTWTEVAHCNDRAYGVGPDSGFGDAFSGFAAGETRAYVAVQEGEPVASVVAGHHRGDCGIYFVATVPEAQGRGLAAELMRIALREAAAAGCDSTSLEATARGEPLYARLGYRSLGRLGMWELRRAPGGSGRA